MSPRLLHRQRRFTRPNVFVDLFHFLHEDLPVLRHLDGGHWRSQDLDFILLQNTQLGQLHAAVESRLTTEGQQHAVWSLVLYHLSAK